MSPRPRSSAPEGLWRGRRAPSLQASRHPSDPRRVSATAELSPWAECRCRLLTVTYTNRDVAQTCLRVSGRVSQGPTLAVALSGGSAPRRGSSAACSAQGTLCPAKLPPVFQELETGLTPGSFLWGWGGAFWLFRTKPGLVKGTQCQISVTHEMIQLQCPSRPRS